LQGRVTNESRAYDLLKQADRAMAMSYKNMTSVSFSAIAPCYLVILSFRSS
jgi:hypothetical protein